MELVIVAAACIACATAAVSDWRTRRIPNAVAAAIAVVGLVRLGLAPELLAEGYTLTTAAGAFAVGFVLFRHGAMGGGDVKMISATILVVGYQHVLGFLFLMSLCGGTLALVTLAAGKLGFASSHRRETAYRNPMQHDRRQETERRLTVPYGVAVAAAGIVSLITMG